MLSKIKKMAVGQTMIYQNPPFCSSILLSAISTNGRKYSVSVEPGMISRAFRVTRTA